MNFTYLINTNSSKRNAVSEKIIIDPNLKLVLIRLDNIKEKLGLSDMLKEKAEHFYKRIIEKNNMKGRAIDFMLAAAIYVACRESETSHTLVDISRATNLKRKNITKYYRFIVKNLNLQMPVSDNKESILRISISMGISEKTTQHVIKILNIAKQKNHLAGKNPMGVTAAAIYLASGHIGEKISQRKLAEVAMITSTTIRNRCKGLRSIA